MKRLLAILLLLPALALAAPYDLVISQRNSDDSGLAPSRRMSPPTDGASALLAYNGGSTQLPTMWRLGTGLTLVDGVLSATVAPVAPPWDSVTGKPAAYPSTLALVTGLQSALDAKASIAALAPVATAGTYASLSGIPTTFPPAAHTHTVAQVTGLQSALDAKLATPTGTTAQYVRGDGSLATLPVAKRQETYSGVTNAQGQFVVTYPTAFAAVPNLQPAPVSNANQKWVLTASTTTGFTLTLTQRNSVTLLGSEVLLGATAPVAAAAAQVQVTER